MAIDSHASLLRHVQELAALRLFFKLCGHPCSEPLVFNSQRSSQQNQSSIQEYQGNRRFLHMTVLCGLTVILIFSVRTKYRISSDSHFMFRPYFFLVSDRNKFSFALGNTNNATSYHNVCFILHIIWKTCKCIPWLNFYENQLLRSSRVLPLLLGLNSINKFTLQR